MRKGVFITIEKQEFRKLDTEDLSNCKSYQYFSSWIYENLCFTGVSKTVLQTIYWIVHHIDTVRTVTQ